MSDLLQIFLLALLSMFNPALLAAVTVMMLLEGPKRLMLGYLLGAYVTSIGLGLTIVFALQGSSAVSTGQSTISPAGDIAIGMLALIIAFVLATDRDRGLRARKERRKREKRGEEDRDEKESLPLRLLGRGSPRVAFAVGVLLSFPGASYLAGLGHIDLLGTSTVATVLLVVGFCLIQLMLLELPLIGFALAPERTQDAVSRFRAWLARRGRHAAIIGAAAIGVAAVIKGAAGLLA